MEGAIAIIGSSLAFLVPLAIPLMVQRWTTFAVVLAAGVAFFLWLNLDIQAVGPAHWLGPFIGGLMLFGFAGGTIARFVMLVGRPRA